MGQIAKADFFRFCSTLEGKEFLTRAGRSRFAVRVVEESLIFTPSSTKKPRPESSETVATILERFNQSGSYTTSNYQEITVNASYMLTLIEAFLKQKPTSFTVRIHKAEPSGFWAEVPDFPGCVTQGETIDELLSNLREAIGGWLSI